MFTILDLTKDNVIAFKAHGKIEETDYDKLNPLLEKTEREGKSVHLFIEVGDIEGITAMALLKDIVTYFKHIRKVDKVAVVGSDKPEKSWAKVADPFIRAEIKYFPETEREIAEEWIQE